MKFGSVCSGIEAATVAWQPLGWEAAWLAEIEKFPSAVLAHHYGPAPGRKGVENLGDMTKIAVRITAGEVESPDIFTGGCPCQAFSVAGLRKSLGDSRGQLSLEFCRIADAIDARRRCLGQPECIIIYENVPGMLSADGNAFGCFLAGLAGEDDEIKPPGGKWTNAGVVVGPSRTVAWRVLDAQFFGLAQRRKRVWVVASARQDVDPAAILFEREGMQWHPGKGDEAGQDAAREVACCLKARGGLSLKPDHETYITGQEVVPYDLFQVTAPLNRQERDEKSPCHTLARDNAAHAAVVCFPWQAGGTQQFKVGDDKAGALTKCQTLAVASFAQNQAGEVRESDVANTLGTNANASGRNTPMIRSGPFVRRLTPSECEKLQGFPVSYTQIPWRKKPAESCPDGPRYKALGNSWAVPCARWIGQRIISHLAQEDYLR